jgi:hypothetical protein
MADNNGTGHSDTYAGFIAATKWGTAFVVTVVLGMYVFLV